MTNDTGFEFRVVKPSPAANAAVGALNTALGSVPDARLRGTGTWTRRGGNAWQHADGGVIALLDPDDVELRRSIDGVPAPTPRREPC